MAQQKKDPANYYLSIAGDGSFWTLRINDVTVWSDFSGEDVNLTLPVNHYLKSGHNDVSVDFVSIDESGQIENAANPSFYFLAEVERLDLTTRERKKAGLLNLGLNDQNHITFPPMTRFNQPVVVATTPPMLIDKTTMVGDSKLIRGWDVPWQARRVSASFEIADTMPAFPWTDAPALAETPELRANVLSAYRQLHMLLSDGDRTKIASAYGTAWGFTAQAFHYTSTEEFIETSGAFADLAPLDPSGKSLQPLDLVRGEKDFELDFMADGRLVRILPDPLIWTSEAEPDEVKSTNVVFFLGPNGQLQIGSVLY